MMPQRAGAIMTCQTTTIESDTAVVEALTMFTERGLRCLPVVDAEHRVLAVLDERELLHARLRGTPETVGGLVGGRAVCVAVTATTDTVAAAILENDVPAAAVMDAGELIGVVTREDALRALLRERARRFDAYADAGGWRVRVDEGAVTIVGPARSTAS